MLGEFSLFVTSVTNAGTHISFHAQLNREKFAALDQFITQHQGHFEQSKLGSSYELRPGETVLVCSASGGAPKWHRARVVNLQAAQYGNVGVEYIDYGTSEVTHYTQICPGRSSITNQILAQPPLAVPCVLAEVLPALGSWSDAAMAYVESKLRAHPPVQAHLLRQDPDGVWHVRVFTGDGRTLASQLVALGYGHLAGTAAQPPPPNAVQYPTVGSPQYPTVGSPLAPAARGPDPGSQFATRVKELTSVPPPPGSEALVTVCHYISGPAKFAIQLHEQQPALNELMSDIQAYCQSCPPVPLSAVESGMVCLGSSVTREGRYLRGVITQADGNVVKVYWADYGNDETKVASELRAMPRQFTQLRIQASRVSLAGLAALVPVHQGRAESLFRQRTEGSVLTGRFAKPRDHQPAGGATGATGGTTCLNQVELLDMGVSVLEMLIHAGAYERRDGSPVIPGTSVSPVSRRPVSPAVSPELCPPPPPLTPGTHAEVRVVSVTSVSSLHVRPLDGEPALRQLLQRLTDALNVSACPLPLDRRTEGAVCAAFKDASYQRARVVSVGRRDMKVLYIDLGTSEILPAGATFAVEPSIANYPPQAVHCCLSGLEMSHGTPELVERLRALTAGGRLLCEVLDQLGDKRIVRLTDVTRSPPLDVGGALRDMMSAGRPRVPSLPPTPTHSVSTPPATGSVATPPRQSPSAAVTVRSPEVELGRAECITVVFVESAAAFFGQLMSVDADAMYEMEEAMQAKYGAGVTPLRAPAVGTFCVGRSALNETFYRAKILSSTGDRVMIQYIDYGDTEVKTPSEVYPLLPEFAKLPQLGIFCCLSGGEAVPADAFSRLVQDQTLLVLPVFGSGDHYRVTLPADAENAAVLAQLKPFGVHAAAGMTPKSPAAPVGTAVQVSPPAGSTDAVKLPTLQLPIGLFKDVTVTHVESPAEFYVRLREHGDALTRLEAELPGCYARAPPAPVAARQAVAVVTADQQWRRGRVMERKIDQMSVFLVDSGETVTVPLSSVRPLRAEHAQLPAQAVRCGAKGWTDKETAKFRSAVAGRGFLARAEEVSSGTAMVTLAQAEPVKPASLLQPAGSGAVQSPRTAADANNNSKRTSPPPRADQDPNWRDKTTAVPPPAQAPASAGTTNGSAATSWRASDSSRASNGMRTAERRPSGSGQAATRPPSGPPSGPPRPSAKAQEPEEEEPTLERFAGKMRMDDPAEYAPVSYAPAAKSSGTSGGGDWGDASSSGGGGGGGSGGRPASRNSSGGGDSRGKSATPTPAPAPATTPARVEIPAHSATISRRPLPPGETLTVVPTWASGLGRFYVQRSPADAKFTALMEELQRFYGGLRAEDGQETKPEQGKPVAARFTDGGWYRALVRSVTPAELRVLFVDYGNCETVPRRDVKRLKEEHCKMPAQAYCCKFAGVEPAGGQWKTVDEKQLAKYFSGDMKVTAAAEAPSGSVSAVEVTLAGRKVTDLLVADGLAVRPAPAQTLQQPNRGPFSGLPDAFRAGDRPAVFISYISTPARLYCQLSANAAPIEEMEALVEAAAADAAKPLSAATAGAGCLAPFDGTFYRGVVVKAEGDSATVHFIDYGNTETVPAGELLECPEALRKLPAQAVWLCLTGVPLDRTDDLAGRADQMEFVARVDRVNPDHLDVTLFDGDTDINRELGGTGKLVPAPSSAAAPSSVTVAKTPAAAAKATEAPKKVTFSLPAPTAAAPERRPVSVSFTVSPEEFYVQEATAATQLDELMTQLDTEYAQLADGERAVKEVQAGDLLAAPFSEDGAFYRARVLVIGDADGDTSRLHLQFIDYGNSEWSDRAGCRLLTPPLLAPAPFAQRCRLAGASAPDGGWTPEAAAALETLTGAPDAQVKMVMEKEEGGRWAVRLTGIGGEDVAQALVEQGHAAAEASQPTGEKTTKTEGEAKPTAESAEPAAPATGAAGLASLVPGRPVPAAVAFSLGPCDFWVQLLADSARLDALMEALEAAGELPVAERANAGTLVAVRYAEDGALYRARVLPEPDSVVFIDYGNTETATAGELRQLPESLATEPPLAVRCSLPLRPAEGATERFAELADAELELQLTLVAAGDPAIVTLTHEGRDLVEVLIEEGLAERAEVAQTSAEATEPEKATDSSAATNEAQKTADSASPSAEETPATTGDTGDHEVFVSHVNSPLEFYVQSPDTTELDALMERLAEAAEAETLTPLEDVQPSAAELVAAPFSEDSAMYRARVLSTADGRARVLFVDYGNGEEVDVGSVCRLPEELTALPPQALRCRLGVEACAVAAADRLRQMTEEGARMTRLAAAADAAGPVALVRLTVEGGDVAEALTAAGLCRAARRLTLPPALPLKTDRDTEVRVTHVGDGDEVYLVPAADAAALRELREMTAELYGAETPPPALAAPAADELCIVQGEDSAWHRAVVLSLGEDGTARVRLVDSGAILEAPLTQLRQPLQAVSLLAPLAHRCHVASDVDSDRLREARDSPDGLVSVRLSADGDRLMVRLAGTSSSPAPAPAEASTTADEAPKKTSPTDRLRAEALAASPSVATPSPRRLNRDDKIVPGQISFSLLREPEPEPEPAVDDSEPAAPKDAAQDVSEELAPTEDTKDGREANEVKPAPAEDEVEAKHEEVADVKTEGAEEAETTMVEEAEATLVEADTEASTETESTTAEVATEKETTPTEAETEAEATPSKVTTEATPTEAEVQIEATLADEVETEGTSVEATAAEIEVEVEAIAAEVEIETTPTETDDEIEATPTGADVEIEATPTEVEVVETEATATEADVDVEIVETKATSTEVEVVEIEATPAEVEVEVVEIEASPAEVEVKATPAETEIEATPTEVEIVGVDATSTEVEIVEIEATPAEVEVVETEATSSEVEVVEVEATPAEVEIVETEATPAEVEIVETEATPAEVEIVETEATPAETEVEIVETEATPAETELETEATPAEAKMETEATPDEHGVETKARPAGANIETGAKSSPSASYAEDETEGTPITEAEIEATLAEIEAEFEATSAEVEAEVEATPTEGDATSVKTDTRVAPVEAYIEASRPAEAEPTPTEAETEVSANAPQAETRSAETETRPPETESTEDTDVPTPSAEKLTDTVVAETTVVESPVKDAIQPQMADVSPADQATVAVITDARADTVAVRFTARKQALPTVRPETATDASGTSDRDEGERDQDTGELAARPSEAVISSGEPAEHSEETVKSSEEAKSPEETVKSSEEAKSSDDTGKSEKTAKSPETATKSDETTSEKPVKRSDEAGGKSSEETTKSEEATKSLEETAKSSKEAAKSEEATKSLEETTKSEEEAAKSEEETAKSEEAATPSEKALKSSGKPVGSPEEPVKSDKSGKTTEVPAKPSKTAEASAKSSGEPKKRPKVCEKLLEKSGLQDRSAAPADVCPDAQELAAGDAAPAAAGATVSDARRPVGDSGDGE